MSIFKRFISSVISAACAVSVLGGSFVVPAFADTADIEVLSVTSDQSEARQKIEQVVEIVNEERAKEGIAPVTLNETLTEAAMLRAEEIAQLFSHTRPDGTSCFTVLKDYNIGYWSCAENIAAGSSTAEGVMDQWVNSSGHYENLMNSDYSEIGVGYCYDPDSTYGYNWVQLFIDPKDPVTTTTTTTAATTTTTTTTTTSATTTSATTAMTTVTWPETTQIITVLPHYYIGYIDLSEIDENPSLQYYFCDEDEFRTDGIEVYNNTGWNITNESTFDFGDVTPQSIYDGYNTEYEIIFEVGYKDWYYGWDYEEFSMNVKIGQRGDANEDGIVDIHDVLCIYDYYNKASAGIEVDDIPWGDYNGDGIVDLDDASLTAEQITTIDSDANYYPINRYSISGEDLMISSASGVPGETVTLYVNVAADNNFRGMDAVISCDPELSMYVLPEFINTDGTYQKFDNVMALSTYNYEAVPDGYIAAIDLTIPDDAEIGTEYNVSFVDLDAVVAEGGDITDTIGISGGTITVRDYSYELVDSDADGVNDCVTITDCAKSMEAFVIPDEIEGLPVTSIGYSAFSGCENLTSITIPDSVTSIGDNAFYGCTSLTGVEISDNIMSIGDYAFYGCNKITNIAVPGTVSLIGTRAIGYSSAGNIISDFKIYGISGSAAEAYALENGMTFIDVNNTPMLSEIELSLDAGESYILEVKNYGGDIIWGTNDDGVATVKDGFVSAVGAGETVVYAIIGNSVLKCNVTVTEAVTATTPAVTTAVTTQTTVAATAESTVATVTEVTSTSYVPVTMVTTTASSRVTSVSQTTTSVTSSEVILSSDLPVTMITTTTSSRTTSVSQTTTSVTSSKVTYTSYVPIIMVTTTTSSRVTSVSQTTTSVSSSEVILSSDLPVTMVTTTTSSRTTSVSQTTTSVTSSEVILSSDLPVTMITTTTSSRVTSVSQATTSVTSSEVILSSDLPVTMITTTTGSWITSVSQATTSVSATAASDSSTDVSSEITVISTSVTPVESTPSVSVTTSETEVNLSKTELNMTVGEKSLLKLEGYNGNIAWISSNENVAAVDANGYVQAIGEGTAVIFVTYGENGEKNLSCVVTVEGLGIPDKISGDANDDGELTVRDAAFIARLLAEQKTDELPENADYNGDGVVNVRDAAAIARALASAH